MITQTPSLHNRGARTGLVSRVLPTGIKIDFITIHHRSHSTIECCKRSLYFSILLGCHPSRELKLNVESFLVNLLLQGKILSRIVTSNVFDLVTAVHQLFDEAHDY